jgi:hypothetical protein
MPALGEAVTRYHRLMEQNGFGDKVWAEELQQRMRQQRLTDSGRLLSPVLRPCFVTQRQLDSLAKTATQLSSIFDQMEKIVLARPGWLSRLQMLPAEKSLLSVPPGYKHFSMAGSFDASFHGPACAVSGVDACRPTGLAYANALADTFLELPIVKEFKRNGHKISKLPGLRKMSQSVTAAWSQFGGKGKPAVAVVDWAHTAADGASEGEMLTELLAAQGLDARFIPPEKLAFRHGQLLTGDKKIDVVLRRILARELLTRWDLTHPLLEAYRARAVCVVNSFRAEIGQRRGFLELLTDETVTAHLPVAADRKLLKQLVRWTRVVSARKVAHDGVEVDLLDWIVKNRERLTLLPDQPSPDLRTYAGSHMTGIAWEWALRQALRTPYVVQESGSGMLETFPFFQYGEFKLREVDVTVQAQLLNGELGDCTAVLHAKVAGSVTPLGIAPVLLVG